MAEIKFGEFYKPVTKVCLIEAPIVGVILILIFIYTSCILKCIYDRKKNHNFHMILSIFISGYLFHILCDYCEIIPNT
jgi:hypothetical protein